MKSSQVKSVTQIFNRHFTPLPMTS